MTYFLFLVLLFFYFQNWAMIYQIFLFFPFLTTIQLFYIKNSTIYWSRFIIDVLWCFILKRIRTNHNKCQVLECYLNKIITFTFSITCLKSATIFHFSGFQDHFTANIVTQGFPWMSNQSFQCYPRIHSSVQCEVVLENWERRKLLVLIWRPSRGRDH